MRGVPPRAPRLRALKRETLDPMTQPKSSVSKQRSLIVCLTGSESTGKTTLARALAQFYRAPVVKEAARGYLAGRANYGQDDVRAIACEQLRLEANALADDARLVICDTDLLVIRIWWEVKYGALPDWLDRHLRQLTPPFISAHRPGFSLGIRPAARDRRIQNGIAPTISAGAGSGRTALRRTRWRPRGTSCRGAASYR